MGQAAPKETRPRDSADTRVREDVTVAVMTGTRASAITSVDAFALATAKAPFR
jgi:hypothetical protein